MTTDDIMNASSIRFGNGHMDQSGFTWNLESGVLHMPSDGSPVTFTPHPRSWEPSYPYVFTAKSGVSVRTCKYPTYMDERLIPTIFRAWEYAFRKYILGHFGPVLP